MEIHRRLIWPRVWRLLRGEQPGSLPWVKREVLKRVCCGCAMPKRQSRVKIPTGCIPCAKAPSTRLGLSRRARSRPRLPPRTLEGGGFIRRGCAEGSLCALLGGLNSVPASCCGEAFLPFRFGDFHPNRACASTKLSPSPGEPGSPSWGLGLRSGLGERRQSAPPSWIRGVGLLLCSQTLLPPLYCHLRS